MTTRGKICSGLAANQLVPLRKSNLSLPKFKETEILLRQFSVFEGITKFGKTVKFKLGNMLKEWERGKEEQFGMINN